MSQDVDMKQEFMISDVRMRTRSMHASTLDKVEPLPSSMKQNMKFASHINTKAKGEEEFFKLITEKSGQMGSDYILGQHIASGSFGSVYLLKNDPGLAMKTIPVNGHGGIPADVVREINIYSHVADASVQCLKLAEVVLIESTTFQKRSIGLVSPYANSKSLGSFMTSPKFKHLFFNRKTSLSFFQYLCKQICSGASALNESRFVHQDIKPDNYLVFDSDPTNFDNMLSITVKVADMGSVTLSEGELSLQFKNGVCTMMFAPPEFYNFGFYDARSDTWSVAITFMHLLAGDFVPGTRDGQYTFGQLRNDQAVRARISEVVDLCMTKPYFANWTSQIVQDLKGMLYAMMTFDIRQRITTTSLLHKAFGTVPSPSRPLVGTMNSNAQCVDVRALTRELVKKWGNGVVLDAHANQVRRACLAFIFNVCNSLHFINIMCYVFIINTMDRILEPMAKLNKQSIEVNVVACINLVVKCLVADPTAENKLLMYCWNKGIKLTVIDLILAEASIMKTLNGNITLHGKWEECDNIKEVGDLLLMSFKPFLLLSFFVITAKKKSHSTSRIIPDRLYQKYFGAKPTSKRAAACNQLTIADALNVGKFKELGDVNKIVDFVSKDDSFQTLVHWEE